MGFIFLLVGFVQLAVACLILRCLLKSETRNMSMFNKCCRWLLRCDAGCCCRRFYCRWQCFCDGALGSIAVALSILMLVMMLRCC